MRSALPGNSSPTTTVALTKVALRLFRLADLADAVGDLTGLGYASVESLVRTAQNELANRPSAEFTAVSTADREWIEDVLVRTYIRLAAEPSHRVMGESLIGAEAVVRLAEQAMTAGDRRDVDAASEDTRAYLDAVSESIAYLISKWYSTNAEPNRTAMSQATGETLQTVRTIPNLIEALKAHLDSALAPALVRLEQSMSEAPGAPPEPEPERIVFQLDSSYSPLANDAELNELVSAAAVAVLEDRPAHIGVSLPSLDEDVKRVGDTVLAAQLKRERQIKAQRLQLALSAFFSPQVETAWASTYLRVVSARVRVVRAILAERETTHAKLDVWRTMPPRISAPIWLTPDEVHAVVESVKLNHWDQLRGGAGWRAADELPRSVILEKVMPSILVELVRGQITNDEHWPADFLFLPSWHIGQG